MQEDAAGDGAECAASASGSNIGRHDLAGGDDDVVREEERVDAGHEVERCVIGSAHISPTRTFA